MEIPKLSLPRESPTLPRRPNSRLIIFGIAFFLIGAAITFLIAKDIDSAPVQTECYKGHMVWRDKATGNVVAVTDDESCHG